MICSDCDKLRHEGECKMTMIRKVQLAIRPYCIDGLALIAAKEAIKAMREPSEQMIIEEEMIIKQSIDLESGGPDINYSKEVYQTMIDAALKE